MIDQRDILGVKKYWGGKVKILEQAVRELTGE
jgi:hypothetical protein